MTKAEINDLLQSQQSVCIQPGYNYAVFSIKTNNPIEIANIIRNNKDDISNNTGIQLLPFVCYLREKSVVIPVPFEASLNVLSKVLEDILYKTDAKIPSWN